MQQRRPLPLAPCGQPWQGRNTVHTDMALCLPAWTFCMNAGNKPHLTPTSLRRLLCVYAMSNNASHYALGASTLCQH